MIEHQESVSISSSLRAKKFGSLLRSDFAVSLSHLVKSPYSISIFKFGAAILWSVLTVATNLLDTLILLIPT